MTTTLMAAVPEYPKIETLWNRDERTFAVRPGEWRCPEFAAVNKWQVTEKIDGTNVRVALLPDGRVFYGGKTDAAQVPPFLMEHMRAVFTPERLAATFRAERLCVLYGEGYGPKIQGGGAYRADVSVRLFDCLIGGVWLERNKLEEIAASLGAPLVPVLADGIATEQAAGMVNAPSMTAQIDGGTGKVHEGIVARSMPLMLTRMGERVIWKLKGKDFREGKR